MVQLIKVNANFHHLRKKQRGNDAKIKKEIAMVICNIISNKQYNMYIVGS